MKVVAAILLVLSQVSLRSCRTRHSISLLQDGGSSEVTLVAPHKVPTIAQLIPILEGLDPPETKISKLKKLIPIYDELNRWRLNNKKRLVEIIPLKKKVKPLAFILPGSRSYVNKLKTTDGSDEDSDQATVESSSREATRKNTKHQPQTEKHTHKRNGHTYTNKHKSHSSQHSHTHKTDTSASHTASEENKSENSATEHNLSRENVQELPEDVNDSDSSESSYGSKESDSNESESESNESGSSVPESNESNSGLNPDLEISEIDTSKSNEVDSNYKSNEAIIDSDPNETALESILSYIDLDSSKSDLETNTESSESSVTIDSSKSEFNDESSKMDYDSDFNESFLMSSDYNSNSKSDSESSVENSESVAPDAVLSSESYSESDSNSELNNSFSQSESAESEISDSESSQSVSESIEGTTNVITKIDDTADSSKAEESQVGTRRLNKHHENDDEDESINTTLLDNQSDKKYDYFFNFDVDNAIDEPADTTQMVDKFHGDYHDVKEFEMENTNIVKQNHEIGGESNDNGQSNEINEPIVAISHVTHQINDESNKDGNDDAPKDAHDSKAAVPINITHATKKHDETTTHINKQHHKNYNQELEESTKLIPMKPHEHKHHGYDDTVVASKLIANHQNYDSEEKNEPRDDAKPIHNKHHGKHITNHQNYNYEETNESVDGIKPIDNINDGDHDQYQSVVLSKHNENYNDLSNEAGDVLAATRMANIHHESIDNNYYNDDESKLDDFTDYSSDDDQLTEDNEFYDDTESNKAAEANETNDSVAAMKINGRHPEIDHEVASITQTAKTHHEVNNNEPKNDKKLNDYGSIDDELLETDGSVAATNHNVKKHQEDGDNESNKNDKAGANGFDVSNYVNESKNESDTDYKTNDESYTDNELGDKEILTRNELVAASKHITKNYDDSESDHLSRQIINNYDDIETKNDRYYENESNEKHIKSSNHVQNPHKIDEPIFTRRMTTGHDVKLNSQSELCNILRGGSLPKKGAKREKKKYILSFIFNR